MALNNTVVDLTKNSIELETEKIKECEIKDTKECVEQQIDTAIPQSSVEEREVTLHTKHEIIDVPINKPEVTITDDMEIQELGIIDHVVENVVVVSSLFSDRDKVLDAGEIDTEKYRQGVKVFVVLKFAKHVFVKPLQQIKGSDASNQFDEEINESEIEFSDDEQEAAHNKVKLFHQKRQRRANLSNKDESTSTERTPKIRKQPNQKSSYRTKHIAQNDNSFEYTPLQRPRQVIASNNFSPINYNYSIPRVQNPVGHSSYSFSPKGTENSARNDNVFEYNPMLRPRQLASNYQPMNTNYPNLNVNNHINLSSVDFSNMMTQNNPLQRSPQLTLNTPTNINYSNPPININYSTFNVNTSSNQPSRGFPSNTPHNLAQIDDPFEYNPSQFTSNIPRTNIDYTRNTDNSSSNDFLPPDTAQNSSNFFF
ncbi:1651_t:CDS:2 [Ambispora leptoticha]|uniref:1651_t:CDS:1 n=1 Tax=Ambispora leptoticha TaxID=144679 RepID=A0A9N8ZF09_9GLOM|nr:1651_t:CDS:2 [Ambispora leptoticha]